MQVYVCECVYRCVCVRRHTFKQIEKQTDREEGKYWLLIFLKRLWFPDITKEKFVYNGIAFLNLVFQTKRVPDMIKSDGGENGISLPLRDMCTVAPIKYFYQNM